MHGARADRRGREVERDHRGAETAGTAVLEGHDRHHGCAKLSARHRQQIVDQGGDHALARKANQGTRHDDVRLFLDDPAGTGTTQAQTVDADHGRIQTRTATVSTDVSWLQRQHDWSGLAAIGKIDWVRKEADKTTHETAYHGHNTALSGEHFLGVIRSHWGIENRLHWRLDLVMNDDRQRTHSDNGPHPRCTAPHCAECNAKDTSHPKADPAPREAWAKGGFKPNGTASRKRIPITA
jgi:predicted transposase YbfD/YdcC